MRIRIAVASSDGKVVNRHFGRCGRFIVVELELISGAYHFVEFREIKPVCGYGGHSHGDLLGAVKLLSDCRYVMACRIGPGAKAALKEIGIEPVEYAGFISEALNGFHQ